METASTAGGLSLGRSVAEQPAYRHGPQVPIQALEALAHVSENPAAPAVPELERQLAQRRHLGRRDGGGRLAVLMTRR